MTCAAGCRVPPRRPCPAESGELPTCRPGYPPARARILTRPVRRVYAAAASAGHRPAPRSASRFPPLRGAGSSPMWPERAARRCSPAQRRAEPLPLQGAPSATTPGPGEWPAVPVSRPARLRATSSGVRNTVRPLCRAARQRGQVCSAQTSLPECLNLASRLTLSTADTVAALCPRAVTGTSWTVPRCALPARAPPCRTPSMVIDLPETDHQGCSGHADSSPIVN